uniref:Uncharacterized protein n=1 Tax=Rhizobium leguminosarum TaxID=384 RepID=A0A179BVD5_RHILE|nr:hypothetical protein A4U53_18030 [Rhizobium leguminosarum]
MTNSEDDFDRSPNPGEMVHFIMPTPRKSGAHHGPEITKAMGAKTTGVSLVTTMAMGERQLAPTPLASDYKGSLGVMSNGKVKSQNVPTYLRDQKWAGARALAQLLQSHGLTGTAALPITYGWMMGYPAGWLSRALRSAVQEGRLQPALSSKRSATPSARKSPKPSAEPL